MGHFLFIIRPNAGFTMAYGIPCQRVVLEIGKVANNKQRVKWKFMRLKCKTFYHTTECNAHWQLNFSMYVFRSRFAVFFFYFTFICSMNLSRHWKCARLALSRWKFQIDMAKQWYKHRNCMRIGLIWPIFHSSRRHHTFLVSQHFEANHFYHELQMFKTIQRSNMKIGSVFLLLGGVLISISGFTLYNHPRREKRWKRECKTCVQQNKPKTLSRDHDAIFCDVCIAFVWECSCRQFSIFVCVCVSVLFAVCCAAHSIHNCEL